MSFPGDVIDLNFLYCLRRPVGRQCVENDGKFKFKYVDIGQMGFPGGASDKEPACQCRRQETWVQSLGQGRDPGELGNPL